jgi:opacity protein-like surface antigen
MKRYVLLFGALLLAASASAQSIGFGVHGNMFNSDINAKAKQLAGIPNSTGTAQVAIEEVYGLGLGGGVHFDLGLSILKIRVSGDYLTLSPDKDKFKGYVQSVLPGFPVAFEEGGKVDMISGSVNLKLIILPLPVFKPYITGGGGVTHVTATDVILSVNKVKLSPITILKTQTVGSFNAGAGLDLDFTAFALFAEARVNWIMLDEGTSTYVPIFTAGITF